MKRKSGILAFVLSAVVLWVLSLDFVPFIEVYFGGRTTIITILIVALLLGIINFTIVAFLKSFFKKGSPAFLFIIALIIDAIALSVTSFFMNNFTIAFWPHAIIAAAILAAVCSLAGLVE